MGEALKTKQALQGNGDGLWFVTQNNTLSGPFTATQLEKKLRDGSVSSRDFCWKDSFLEWRPLYSIQYFQHVKTKKDSAPLADYPSIPIPSQNNAAANEKPTQENPQHNVYHFPKQNNLQIPKFDKNRVTVSLSRTKTHFLSVYEWAIAALCALAFGWTMVKFSLKNVETEFHSRLSLIRLADEKNLGRQDIQDTIYPWSLGQLTSAPGFQELLAYTDVVFSMSGHIAHETLRSFTGNNISLETAQFPINVWKSDENNIDLVYQKPHSAKIKMISDPKQAKASPSKIKFIVPYSSNPFVSPQK